MWASYSLQEVCLNEKGNKFILQVLLGFKRQTHNSTLHNILRKCFPWRFPYTGNLLDASQDCLAFMGIWNHIFSGHGEHHWPAAQTLQPPLCTSGPLTWTQYRKQPGHGPQACGCSRRLSSVRPGVSLPSGKLVHGYAISLSIVYWWQ